MQRSIVVCVFQKMTSIGQDGWTSESGQSHLSTRARVIRDEIHSIRLVAEGEVGKITRDSYLLMVVLEASHWLEARHTPARTRQLSQ